MRSNFERSTRYMIVAFAAVALSLISTSSPRAQEKPIGQVKTASGDAAIVRNNNRIAAKPGDSVFQKDVIETGADGAIGITFTDNTVMAAGPNSEVAMEEYTFDSSNFKGSMMTDMRKGTLSMVSGDIAKSSHGAMKVRTPAAILGVSGTHFAVQVNPS
jgi:hypothetical protein